MITMNFQAVTGAGVRQRVIIPAIRAQTKPVFIVGLRDILDCNWSDFVKDRKLTPQKFAKLAKDGLLFEDALYVVDRCGLSGKRGRNPEDKLQVLLSSIKSEVWTVGWNVTWWDLSFNYAQ